MNSNRWLVLVFVLCAGLLYGDSVDGDLPVGYSASIQKTEARTVELPADFSAEEARIEIKAARQAGDQSRVQELAEQLNAWWQLNRETTYYPDDHGYNDDPGPQWNIENRPPNGGAAPDWSTDVRISPSDDVYQTRIASISNGDLYSIAIWESGTEDHILIHRSTDDGATWNTYWDNNFGTTEIHSVNILNVNDTLLISYILEHPSVPEMRTWMIASLPGASLNAIYFGSPTGSFSPIVYTDLHATTDAPVWGTSEYIYASWCERYGSGPDSTRVMSGVSYSIDVTAWEFGPTKLTNTAGANIYYTGTKTAYGSATDRMWLISWLHPYGYPTSFDRTVKGWYSDDYGSTWSARIDITPNNNGRDEFDCVIAGSHSNTNWVVLATQVDTGSAGDRDVNNWYSTDDGGIWTWAEWLSNSYENFFGDIWVDENSTAFYGALRQNTSTAEYIRYKEGNINDPTTWGASVAMNDDPTGIHLSDVYGPSISYNTGNGDAIIAWNDFAGATYSIWFDSESWTGVAERPGQEVSPLAIGLAPNPAKSAARLSFTIQTEGRVTVSLYDAAGRLVENLLSETRAAGTYSTAIETGDIAAGIYFVRVETPDGVGTRTITIVR